jgi:hypothetical protein
MNKNPRINKNSAKWRVIFGIDGESMSQSDASSTKFPKSRNAQYIRLDSRVINWIDMKWTRTNECSVTSQIRFPKFCRISEPMKSFSHFCLQRKYKSRFYFWKILALEIWKVL